MKKPGCKVVTIILFSILGLSFLITLPGVRGCSAGQQMSDFENREVGAEVGRVDDQRIVQQVIDQIAQPELNPTTVTASTAGVSVGRATDQVVTQAYLAVIAKQMGITLDDKTYIAASSRMLDEILPLYAKSMKPDQIQQIKQQQLDQLKSDLQNPETRQQRIGSILNQVVMDGIEQKLNVSDEEIKHSNDLYHLKRIFLNQAKRKDAVALGNHILDDLKSGKLKFEDAMNQFTDDVAAKGKKPQDNDYQIDARSARSSDEFAGIAELRPGQISGLLPVKGMPGGVAIYRLESIQPVAMQGDVNTTRQNYVGSIAAKELQDKLASAKSAYPVKWSVPGYAVLYEWYKTTQDPQESQAFLKKTEAEQRAYQLDVFKRALPNQDEGGAMAALGSIDAVWSKLSADEKQKLEKDRIQALNYALQYFDSYAIRMELADYYAKAKSPDDAFKNLSQAASINGADVTSAEGERRFGDLSAKVDAWQKSGFLKKDQIDQIRQTLNNWRTERAGYDEQMAKQAKEAADAKKKQEEEDKKRKAEEKNKKPVLANPGADKPNGGGAPAPTGPTAPGALPGGLPTPKTTGK